MTSRVELDPKDYRHLLYVLRELPRRVGIKVLRIALNAWGGVVRDRARQTVLRATKSLYRALSVKVKIPDASYNVEHHGKPAYVIVGAKRQAVGPVIVRKGKRKSIGLKRATKIVLGGGKVRANRPSRYAHLVERKRAFIGPAQRTGEQAGMEKLKDKLRTGIESEARALANR